MTVIFGCGPPIGGTSSEPSGRPGSVTGCPNYVVVPETGPFPSDFDEDHPIAREHERLDPDLETARSYALAHADEFGSIRWENVPRVRVVIGFTDHLDAHCAALRGALAFPDEFELIWSAPTATSREDVQAEIMAGYQDHLLSVGQAAESVSVNLRPDAEAAAAEIAAAYGELVDIWVGMLHYPDRAVGDRGPCDELLPDQIVGLPLEATLRLDVPEIRFGGDIAGTVNVLNVGAEPFDFSSGEPLTAFVLAEGGIPVGAYAGAIAGVGRGAMLEPGGSIELDVVGGTASCDPALGYAVPPGDYVVVVPVDVITYANPNAPATVNHLFSNAVPITIVP